MSNPNRRRFLQLSGAVLGGIATGTTVTAKTRTDRFLVDVTGSTRQKIERSDATVVHDLDAIDLLVVEGPKAAVSEAAEEYVPDIEIEFDGPAVSKTAPSASASAADLQWDKDVLSIDEAHDVTRGEGTRVAVIDTGVDAKHPALDHAVNTSLSKNFTGDGYGAGRPYGGDHGTHVGGIIAADAPEDDGVIGTAPATDLVDCRVFSPDSLASFADILAAIEYSVSIGCDAVNLSLGSYPNPRQGNGEFYGKVLNRALTHANEEGTLLVVAAGNDSADLQHDGDVISLPNEGAQAFSIAATGPIGYMWGEEGLEAPPESPAFYTNYGTNAIDIAAPGGDADQSQIGSGGDWRNDLVYNTISTPKYADDGTYLGTERTYGWHAGTSMAAPQVAGAAALVKSANPSYHPNKLDSALRRAASVPHDYDKTYYGSGFLNVLDAL
ncbi:S8 family serine peptidase [Haloarculaceae archaeon H-GB2-1]|nr:S8 family serine peptidase [Haloarculaceae archaeon H-GB1-1]MEA5408952.1 S8 family serine peptidase [Haloarculaceae archaeon H-GB2-1]